MPLGRFAAYFCALTTLCVIAFPQVGGWAGSRHYAANVPIPDSINENASDAIIDAATRREFAASLQDAAARRAKRVLAYSTHQNVRTGLAAAYDVARRQSFTILAHATRAYASPYPTE